MLYTSGGLTTVCFILSSPPLQLIFSYLSIIVKLSCVANKSYYIIFHFILLFKNNFLARPDLAAHFEVDWSLINWCTVVGRLQSQPASGNKKHSTTGGNKKISSTGCTRKGSSSDPVFFGSPGSESGSVFEKPDPRIRIPKKMNRIRNTGYKPCPHGENVYVFFDLNGAKIVEIRDDVSR